MLELQSFPDVDKKKTPITLDNILKGDYSDEEL